MFYSEIYRLSHCDNPVVSIETYTFASVVLFIYAISIVFGRLYTAMHSFVDCIAGVALGAGIWWVHESFPGFPISFPPWTYSFLQPLGAIKSSETGSVILTILRSPGLSEKLDAWITSGSYNVPLISIPLTLLAVNQHPQPVDDCPCFEDAIAFGGVVLGAVVGKWAMGVYHVADRLGVPRGSVVMPGSGWTLDTHGAWTQVERGIWDVTMWWSVAALKMVLGIFVIFAWRILAKSLLHLVLPPFFRFLAKSFQLPNRRFYTPATQYKSVPSEFNSEGGLRPIPSVIDLPVTGEEIGGIGSGTKERIEVHHHHQQRLRKVNGSGGGKEGYVMSGLNPSAKHGDRMGGHDHNGDLSSMDKDATEDEPIVKHYDADVLTKVFVYSGIAILAYDIIPLAFDLTGLGVVSSPFLVHG